MTNNTSKNNNSYTLFKAKGFSRSCPQWAYVSYFPNAMAARVKALELEQNDYSTRIYENDSRIVYEQIIG